MAEQEEETVLLARPHHSDYIKGKADPQYHADLAAWKAQQAGEEYVPLDVTIEEQLAEDLDLRERNQLINNIPALDDTNSAIQSISEPWISDNPAYLHIDSPSSFYSTPIQGSSLSDPYQHNIAVGAGGAYARQMLEEQDVKEFREDYRAEQERTNALTDYLRTSEDGRPENVIPLRQQNVDGLYDAYQAGHYDIFSDGFNSSTSSDKLALYYKFYEDGTLERDKYVEIATAQLSLDNPDTRFFERGGVLMAEPYSTASKTELRGVITLFPEQVGNGGYASLMSSPADGRFGPTLGWADIGQANYGFQPHQLGEKLSQDELFNFTIGLPKHGTGEPYYNPSTWTSVVRPFVQTVGRVALGVATGGQSEAWYALYKVANGETLKGEDYANLLISGLKTAGTIQAPTSTSAGVGLGALSYNQTIGVINAIAQQDPLEAFLEYTGTDFDLLENGLSAIGIDAETLGLDPEKFSENLNEIESAIIKGESGTDEFIEEFGGDAFTAVAGEAGDAFDNVIETIGDSEIVQTIEEGGKVLIDAVEEGAGVVGDLLEGPVDLVAGAVEPLINLADEGLDYIGDSAPVEAIEDAGKAVGDVVQTGIDTTKEAGELVVDTIDEGIDYIGEEYVDPALQAIDDALPHGTTPDIDLPDIDLNLAYTPSTPTETESLFGDEISKIYRTPIETYKPAFSEQQIQGMLQQRYRG